MPTPAYTDLDSNAPDGTSGTGSTFSAPALANVRALRDMLIAGRAKGFQQTRTNGTGTANQPQFITWLNAALSIGFRMNMTWTGVKPTSITWEWSNDNGATWTAMGSAQVNTFDASLNLTASTNSGGFFNIVAEIWAKVLQAVSDLATHIAATGTAVHGLASMAIQAASSVAITGGAIDGTPIGGTTRAAGSFTRVVEDVALYTPALNAGVVIDWSKGGSNVTTNGTNAITFINIPSGMAGHRIYIDNMTHVTWPGTVNFGAGGTPVIAATVGITLDTVDAGAHIQASVGWNA